MEVVVAYFTILSRYSSVATGEDHSLHCLLMEARLAGSLTWRHLCVTAVLLDSA
jgi:hypothetical protein